ncbi:MAG: L-rhamnose mutarotase [Spirochaetaceae bacterium]|nr:MAG: L-rhamnose mutarotase [Spirochaetaceae bacterium]
MEVLRFGMVIGIREDRLDEYRALHADDHPGVRDLLSAANIRNFSIFFERLPDGSSYLFGYYEYHGSDFEADMAYLDAEPRNREWIEMTAPMQIPLPGEKAWKVMEEVYHNG